jgi:hypothetical protein
VKLNAEAIRPVSADYGAAADAWSLAMLVLESLTRSPDRSGIDRLGTPFREMVEGGLRPDPEMRWTVRKMGLSLAGRQVQEPVRQEPVREEPVREEPGPRAPEFTPPSVNPANYRRFAGLAVGGALAAAAVCVLLIRGAHQGPAPSPVTIQAPPVATVAPANPVNKPIVAAVPAGWAVVGAAYRRPEDAEKRQAEIQKAHPKLTSRICAAGGRYLVLFGSGFSNEAQAKRQLASVRRGGAPRDSYLTRFR